MRIYPVYLLVGLPSVLFRHYRVDNDKVYVPVFFKLLYRIFTVYCFSDGIAVCSGALPA